MSTDTTPDAAGHAEVIRDMTPSMHRNGIGIRIKAIRAHPHGRPEPRHGHLREIERHVAALDAARIAAEQRASRLDDDALVEVVAEAMWFPYFGGNRDGQSFADRPDYLRASWLEMARNAVAAMRTYRAPARRDRDADAEEAQP